MSMSMYLLTILWLMKKKFPKCKQSYITFVKRTLSRHTNPLIRQLCLAEQWMNDQLGKIGQKAPLEIETGSVDTYFYHISWKLLPATKTVCLLKETKVAPQQ